MPKNNNIEEILLSNASIDELIRQKIDSEITLEIQESKKSKTIGLTSDFKQLNPSLIFDKSTTYLVFNRNTKQESFISGVQAESLIGIQVQIREKLIKKLTDCFLTDNYYVKFYSGEAVNNEI